MVRIVGRPFPDAYRFAPNPTAGGARVTLALCTPGPDLRAVVLVTSRAADEDISDREVRAVLVYIDGRSWRLVSAGERFRCRAGAGHRDWSPQPYD